MTKNRLWNKNINFQNKIILVATIILINTPVNAKEIWIQALGIDETNPSQNYTDFYELSADFSRACQMKSGRICEKYVNDNMSLARNYKAAQASNFNKTSDFKGVISKKDFIFRLQQIISQSTDGDKIVISLSNHGGPPPEGQSGKSCVHLNSTECISEEDIKQVISLAPKGVKTVIVADACYSGAFGDLSNRDTCVISAADQRHTGSAMSLNLWNSIRSGEVKTLADYSKKSIDFGSNVRLGSQNMAANNCESLRNQIMKSFSKDDLKKFETLFQAQTIGPECQPYSGTMYLANLKKIASVFDEIKSKQLISVVCNSDEKEADTNCSLLRQAIKNGELEKNLMQDFADSKLVEQLEKDMTDSANKVNAQNTEISMTIFKKINAYMNPNIRSEPDISSFSVEDQKLIHEIAENFHHVLTKYNSAGKTLLQKVKELNSDKRILDDDIKALKRCLLQARFEKPHPVAEVKPLRQFTNNEIQDAKKCENSFSF